MARTRVRRRRLGATMIVLGLAAGIAGPQSNLGPSGRPEPVTRRSYVVREGDTLWSIATRVSTGDPRPLVDAITRGNGVDPGSLVPGQTLVIPTAG